MSAIQRIRIIFQGTPKQIPSCKDTIFVFRFHTGSSHHSLIHLAISSRIVFPLLCIHHILYCRTLPLPLPPAFQNCIVSLQFIISLASHLARAASHLACAARQTARTLACRAGRFVRILARRASRFIGFVGGGGG